MLRRGELNTEAKSVTSLDKVARICKDENVRGGDRHQGTTKTGNKGYH